jgi:Ca-activated chloride channel family protein
MRHALSTFSIDVDTASIDVDTASYSNVRRFLAHGVLPPPDAVRIEEMINYFDYDYPVPAGDHPFSVDVEATGCPWAPEHRLVRVGLKGDEVAARNRPPANLAFLLDVSGSMQGADKLPLVKRSLRMLVDHLSPADTVAIVVYAGAAGLVLPATSVASKDDILDAMSRLKAGGSTAGGEGIRLAYKIARKNYLPGGINRVILATDGDFNVGVSSTGAMTRLIEKEAQSGVFFTVLGFGMGNLKNDKLENLADKGNGHYAYIDSLFEARKVLVEELGATLVTIAKDVKIQIEFNPALVQSYRLIGYENRLLRSEDFNDDTKDAGEIGAGHTVTALYEIAPTSHAMALPAEDELKYQRPSLLSDAALRGEILTVKVRYKAPNGDTSRLLEVPLIDAGGDLASASPDTRFAAAVACLGMVLREAPDRGSASMDEAERLAMAGLGDDLRGHRARFVEMVRLARTLAEPSPRREN